MTISRQIMWSGKKWECHEYEAQDEPAILNRFLLWKATAAITKSSIDKMKMPQLPETFSEPLCCYVCQLLHKKGTGPDAFKISSDGSVRAIEIKATITPSGFTDIKRDTQFDELYWVLMEEPDYFDFQIFCIDKDLFERYTNKSNTRRDRATITLKSIVENEGIRPTFSGKIGIISGLSAR